MERDEVYVPKTRSDLGIPQEHGHKIDYEEYLGDTPIYTLFMLVRQQLLAFPAYLRKPVASIVSSCPDAYCARQCGMCPVRRTIRSGRITLTVSHSFSVVRYCFR